MSLCSSLPYITSLYIFEMFFFSKTFSLCFFYLFLFSFLLSSFFILFYVFSYVFACCHLPYLLLSLITIFLFLSYYLFASPSICNYHSSVSDTPPPFLSALKCSCFVLTAALTWQCSWTSSLCSAPFLPLWPHCRLLFTHELSLHIHDLRAQIIQKQLLCIYLYVCACTLICR